MLQDSSEGVITALMLSGPRARARSSVPSWTEASQYPLQSKGEGKERNYCYHGSWLAFLLTPTEVATYCSLAIPGLEKTPRRGAPEECRNFSDLVSDQWTQPLELSDSLTLQQGCPSGRVSHSPFSLALHKEQRVCWPTGPRWCTEVSTSKKSMSEHPRCLHRVLRLEPTAMDQVRTERNIMETALSSMSSTCRVSK
ncbi:hypothetical protein CapIbe_005931 [Capra ibex]